MGAYSADYQRRQLCKQLILRIASSQTQVLEADEVSDQVAVRADPDRRPLLVVTIDDPLVVRTYKDESDRLGAASTTLGRTATDVFSVLRHYHSLRDGNLTLARTTPLMEERRIDNDLNQWLEGQWGVEVITGLDGREHLELYMHFPYMKGLAHWQAHWQASPQALAQAVDQGVLEISDAADALNHGLGSYGYGRA